MVELYQAPVSFVLELKSPLGSRGLAFLLHVQRDVIEKSQIDKFFPAVALQLQFVDRVAA